MSGWLISGWTLEFALHTSHRAEKAVSTPARTEALTHRPRRMCVQEGSQAVRRCLTSAAPGWRKPRSLQSTAAGCQLVSTHLHTAAPRCSEHTFSEAGFEPRCHRRQRASRQKRRLKAPCLRRHQHRPDAPAVQETTPFVKVPTETDLNVAVFSGVSCQRADALAMTLLASKFCACGFAADPDAMVQIGTSLESCFTQDQRTRWTAT